MLRRHFKYQFLVTRNSRIAGQVMVLVGVVPSVVHSVLRLTGSGGHIALFGAGIVLVLVGLLLRHAART